MELPEPVVGSLSAPAPVATPYFLCARQQRGGGIRAVGHVGGNARFYFTLANAQEQYADADEKSVK